MRGGAAGSLEEAPAASFTSPVCQLVLASISRPSWCHANAGKWILLIESGLQYQPNLSNSGEREYVSSSSALEHRTL
jgi:hypothetical protein